MKLHKNVEVDKLIPEKELKRVVKDALKSGNNLFEKINESFVAQKNKFNLLTDTLSEKAKSAHYELYKGYVDSFNKVSSKLDSIKKDEENLNHSDMRSLKREEVFHLNALWMHELYFSNCFDQNSEISMDTLSFIRLQRDFGTFDDWQEDFIATALSGGNGWVVCGYNVFLKRFVNTFIKDHSDQVMVGLYPIIVIDMWQHAYYKDYLNDKSSYLISQMKELNWEVIEERVKKAEKIGQIV